MDRAYEFEIAHPNSAEYTRKNVSILRSNVSEALCGTTHGATKLPKSVGPMRGCKI